MCCSAPESPKDVRIIDVGDRKSVVTWLPPDSFGGTSTAKYSVALKPGGRSCETSSTQCAFANLDYGVEYVATVIASNSAESSDAVESSAMTLEPPQPRAPRKVRATLNGEKAVVKWKAPKLREGVTVRTYRVVSSPRSLTCRTSKRTCVLRGLTRGKSYTFTVVSVDSLGRRAESASSRPVYLPPPRPVLAPEVVVPPKPDVPIT